MTVFLVMFLPAIRWAYLSARLSSQAHLPHLVSSILTHSFSSVQEKFQDYYLGMQFMHEFTNETLAIANAWLDPEVMFCSLLVYFSHAFLLLAVANTISTSSLHPEGY